MVHIELPHDIYSDGKFKLILLSGKEIKTVLVTIYIFFLVLLYKIDFPITQSDQVVIYCDPESPETK